MACKGCSNAEAKRAIYLTVGLIIVGVAFEYNKKAGAALLAVVVLGLLLSARRQGAFKKGGTE